MWNNSTKHRQCRLIFLVVAFACCITGMAYYGSLHIRTHGLAYFGLTTSGDSDRSVLIDSLNRTSPNIRLPQHKQSRIYDLHTFGKVLRKCSSNNPMPSPTFSKIRMIFYDQKESLYIVVVDLYDGSNVRRTTGGDVIVVWAEQVGGDGRVSGTVSDNMNGSYTGKVEVFWTGRTVFKVKLASTWENQCLRSNALYRYGNTVYAKQNGWGIHAVFQKGNQRYQTKCGANAYIYDSPQLCNFTDLNANFPWYCGAPPNTNNNNNNPACSDIERFTIGAFDCSKIPDYEKMADYGHGVLKDTRDIDVDHTSYTDMSLKCSAYPSRKTWTYTQPTGYWANGRWNFIPCDNSAMSFQFSTYRTCLNGKYLAVIGDSTTRQISEFIISRVLGYGSIDLKNGVGPGPKRAYQVHNEYKAFNIATTYSKHEFPFHNIDFPPYNITSMPLELQRLESTNVAGKDMIVLLHYYQHLQAYPIEEFHLRIRRLVPAIKRLLDAKPGVTILLKGPHMSIDDVRWFDPRITLIYIDILHKEFHEIRDHVIYLDTWSSTVAHDSELPHPRGAAFVSVIQQLMSYICYY